jgi:hypothetical protein
LLDEMTKRFVFHKTLDDIGNGEFQHKCLHRLGPCDQCDKYIYTTHAELLWHYELSLHYGSCNEATNIPLSLRPVHNTYPGHWVDDEVVVLLKKTSNQRPANKQDLINIKGQPIKIGRTLSLNRNASNENDTMYRKHYGDDWHEQARTESAAADKCNKEDPMLQLLKCHKHRTKKRERPRASPLSDTDPLSDVLSFIKPPEKWPEEVKLYYEQIEANTTTKEKRKKS